VATPISDGLVLWLDADDQASLTTDAGGRISLWADKSDRRSNARQAEANRRPRHVPGALGGRPVVRFDGTAFLNLARPPGLDFRPGDPFTLLVVCRVARGDCGTFLSKGGGEAGQRAYQFYAAPAKQGAITYGVMREAPRTAEATIAVEVCDGRRADVYLNGEPCLSLGAGGALSDVDVLVGARRQNADNSGIYYPLTGDVAEILVYNRALTGGELARVGGYLQEKYALETESLDFNRIDRLVAVLAAPKAAAKLDLLAASLPRHGNVAVAEIESLLKRRPEAALATAELLVRIAQGNRLDEGFAALAGKLLEHQDPFVRGMAEWALAMKVGGENNGQETVWPKPQPPAWFEGWVGLSAARRLEADWVRQAVGAGIHRDAAKLLADVDVLIGRARRMTTDFERSGALESDPSATAGQLAALGAVRAELASAAEASDAPDTARRLWLEARRRMRAVIMQNPLVDFERIIFVKQFAPHTVRNITRSYSWKHKPGGDVCILSGLRSGGDVRPVLQGRLGPGYVWGLDLWWDADRVVFGYARQPNWPPAVDTADSRIEGTHVFELRKAHEPVHLFEVGVDGSSLFQRTCDPYWSDFEPTYCAGGEVVFASDRCGRSAECGNDTYDHTNPNLYVLRPDGSIHHLTDSKDIDRYPHSLGDGRIAYTHWEYQERHFMEVHALWTLRPDGTMSDALYKHHMRAPCGLRDTRSIPGGTKLVSIATGHHTFAYGPVVVVDPNRGLNHEAGLTVVTPGVRPQEGPMAGRPVATGGVPDQGGLYQTPWALSEKCFLVSYAYARPNCTAPAGADSNGFGLYWIDVYGNRELLHRDPLLSCAFPIPLAKRARPPVVSDARPEPASWATCYLTDVYDGMEEVPRGTIHHVRISQHVPWPFDSDRGQMDYIPGDAGTRRIDFQSWSPVRVIGTVPVAADGSASFRVPADTALYFQALDERFMEIRRMRSMVSLKPGEVRGCAGCHESRGAAPAACTSLPLAVRQAPQAPVPPPWGSEKLLNYPSIVQPILDRHCVRCHGDADPDGGLVFTSTRAPDGLFQSFRTMFGIPQEEGKAARRLVSCSDRFSNADVSRPKQFGSHKSPLIRVLVDDDLHRAEVRLSPTEWLSLVTWVDANAPYHDAFLNKRAGGGSPVRNVAPEFPPFAGLGDSQGRKSEYVLTK
jgi:hypothetical protein